MQTWHYIYTQIHMLVCDTQTIGCFCMLRQVENIRSGAANEMTLSTHFVH